MNEILLPLGDRVIVKQLIKEKSDGGLYLPDSAKQDKVIRGKVIASGPGTYQFGEFYENRVKEGDVVCYLKFSAMELDINGQQYFTIKESDIIGIIKEEKTDV